MDQSDRWERKPPNVTADPRELLPVGFNHTLRTKLDPNTLVVDPRVPEMMEKRFGENKETLDQIGQQFGLTRERVRQLLKQTERMVEDAVGRDIRRVVRIFADALPSVFPHYQYRLLTSGIFDQDIPLLPYLQRVADSSLGYQQIGEFCLSPQRAKQLDKIIKSMNRQLGENGTIPTKTFSRLTEQLYDCEIEEIRKRLKIGQLNESLLGKRSNKALVVATLRQAGQPMTFAEMSTACGLNRRQIDVVIHNCEHVVRISKPRWGLTEWGLEEYKGITDTIISRIESGGGSASVKELEEELVTKFEVRPNSVKMYMKAPKFRKAEGRIYIADPSQYRYRPLAQAVDGFDHLWKPYQSFKIKKNHFKGFSAQGFSPEFVRELGCGPDERITAEVIYPSDCTEVTVSWPLTSITQAYLGYLSTPLKKLGAQPGDRVMVIAVDKRKVAFRFDRQKLPSPSAER